MIALRLALIEAEVRKATPEKVPVPRPPSLGVKVTQDTAARRFTETGHTLFVFKGGSRCKSCQAWKCNAAFKEWFQEPCFQTAAEEKEDTETPPPSAPPATAQREPQEPRTDRAEDEGGPASQAEPPAAEVGVSESPARQEQPQTPQLSRQRSEEAEQPQGDWKRRRLRGKQAPVVNAKRSRLYSSGSSVTSTPRTLRDQERAFDEADFLEQDAGVSISPANAKRGGEEGRLNGRQLPRQDQSGRQEAQDQPGRQEAQDQPSPAEDAKTTVAEDRAKPRRGDGSEEHLGA